MFSRLVACLKNYKLFLCIVLLVCSLFFLFEHHIDSIESASLTVEEQQWLKDHPVIRLAPDPDFPPTEFFDANGNHRGAAADYVALIEKKLGIKFQIVKLHDWADVLKKARQREIDVLAAATKTPERSEYLLFTRPYLEFPAVLIARNGFKGPLDLQHMAGKTMSVKAGYAARYYVVTNYPDVKIDVVPDIRSGMEKVSKGTSDAMLENLFSASYFMEKDGITDLHIAGEAEFIYRMAFAVRSDWPILHTILQKGLDRVTHHEREVIYQKWVPLNAQFLLVNKRLTPPILFSIAVLATGIIVVFFWNRTLAKLVDRKTRELHEELIERQRYESALRESEEKFRVLAETSPAGILLYQGERIIYANPSATLLTGFSEQECLRMKFWEWMDPTYRDQVRLFGMARQKGVATPVSYEAKFRTKNGLTKWMLVSAGRIQYRGQPAGIASVVDITDRKLLEEELLQAHEELEKRVEERTGELAERMRELRFTQFAIDRSADQAFWMTSDGRFFYVNDAACLALGYTRDELLTMSVPDIDPTCPTEKVDHYWQVLRENGVDTFETCHRAKSGRVYPVEVRSNLLLFEGKEYNCCFVTDITRRKESEEALRNNETHLLKFASSLQEKQNLLRTLIDSIPDLVFFKDTEGVYLGCNRAFAAFVGRDPKDVVGRTDFDLFPLNKALLLHSLDRNMLSQGKELRREEWSEYPDGHRVLLETLKTPYRDPGGNSLGLICISRDITQRKSVEDSLRRNHDELETRVRERTDQLTNLSLQLSQAEESERRRIAIELHDQVAQTLALSKIKLNMLLLSGDIGDESGSLREISEYLTQSIEEIRSLTFQLSPPLLYEVGLEAALEWLGDHFHEKYGLQVRFRDDGNPKPLDDKVRGTLYQMTRELLVNIVKHAHASNVIIDVSAVSGRISVRIADDGIGLDPTHIMDSVHTTKSFGLLSIFHRIRHLGGELVIDSDPQMGTTCTLELPFRECAK